MPVEKTTWYGSGRHIPDVLEMYPRGEWCICAPRVEWRDWDGRGVVGKGEGEGEGRVWEYPPRGERADGWLKRYVEFGVYAVGGAGGGEFEGEGRLGGKRDSGEGRGGEGRGR